MLRHVCRRFASSEAIKHSRVQHSPTTECLLDRTLRVDHAGEFGAVQIYKGQLAVLGHSDVAPTLQVQLAVVAFHILLSKIKKRLYYFLAHRHIVNVLTLTSNITFLIFAVLLV